MSRGAWLVVVLLLLFIALVVGGGIVIWRMLGDEELPVAADDASILLLDLQGAVPTRPPAENPFERGGGPSLLEIDEALRAAESDEDIERLLVRIGPLQAGTATIEEIRSMILSFRENGKKPATCWFEEAGNGEYLLATACDTVLMAPEGVLLVNGLSLSATFFAGTLEKLGIQAEFTRAGRYKSAVETFTQKEMSEASREMMNALADGMFELLVDAIAKGRGLTKEEVLARIDDPPMTGRAALAGKLVDGLVYRDQLLAHQLGHDLPAYDSAAVQVPPDGFDLEDAPEQLLSVADYASKGRDPSGKKHVALIIGQGEIHSGKSEEPGAFGGGSSIGSETMARAIRQAREDDDVAAIVLRVDSPGGSGLASDIIWREVVLTRELAGKPVIVSMGDVAASGGYYIAMGADSIFASRGTITGSIGVFAGKFNLGGLFDKVGIDSETVERGRLAGIFNADRPLGEDGLRKLEGYVLDFYSTFLDKASLGRKKSKEEIDAVAQGRVWTGGQAQERGLVDQLGGLRAALAEARSRAGLDAEAPVVVLPKARTFLEELLDQATDLGGARAGLRSVGDAVGVDVGALVDVAPLLSSGQPLALMPFAVDVR